jgi:hypothetical protein
MPTVAKRPKATKAKAKKKAKRAAKPKAEKSVKVETTEAKPSANPGAHLTKLMRIPKGIFGIGKIVDKDTVGPHGAVRVSRTLDGKMRADATDGRRAVVVRWQDEFMLPRIEHSCMVPADLALLAEKAIPSKGTPEEQLVQLSAADDESLDFEARVKQGEDSVTVAGILSNGEFPPIDDVMPEYETVEPEDGYATKVTLNAELLIGLLKVFVKAGAYAVEIQCPAKPGRPVKFVSRGEEVVRTIDGLLCPINTEKRDEPNKEHAPFLPGMESPAPPPAVATAKPAPDAWKAVALADVWRETKANITLLALLADGKLKAGPQKGQAANLKTMGDLAAYSAREHAELTDITGIGAEKASAIDKALEAWWKLHPEYTGTECRDVNDILTSPPKPGLEWVKLSETQHFADTKSGVKRPGDREAASTPQFVLTRAGDEGWHIVQSADCLLPTDYPERFDTIDKAKAFCETREAYLCSTSAREQMPEAFEEPHKGNGKK